MTGSCGDELLDENCGVVRILFREEVATLHRLAMRVRSPLPPNAQWTAILCIESVERATLGGQRFFLSTSKEGAVFIS